MSNLPSALRPRRWRLFLMPVLVLIAAVGWTAFWFVAVSQVDQTVDAWRSREAASGRIYDCGSRSIAGFPFRLEVRCGGASMALMYQTAGQVVAQTPALNARLGEILVVAQVYDPKLLIAEFTSPAVVSDRGQPAMIVNWSKARSSIVGLPGAPQRASIIFDDPALDRISASVQAPLLRAKHL